MEPNMRALGAFVVLGVVGASSLALADGWRAKVALEPESPSDCREADVSNLFFDLAETGNELSVKTNTGAAFSAPVAADGSVSTTFTAPIGTRQFAMDLTGNVRTREFNAFNKQYSCRFKLTPV
jgi:hypothetical protein